MDKKNNNVAKIYKMNKYSKAVIEGMGYNVYFTDSVIPYDYYIQGVDSIVDKNTGRGLQGKISTISYGDDYEFDGGERAKLYQCDDGKRIILEKYGKVIIICDDLYIEIDYNHKNDGRMRMRLYNEESMGINFDKEENCILVHDNFNYINQIDVDDNLWFSMGKSHTIEEFTPEYLVECIKESIKMYKNGILWNEKIEKGLDIIAPALRKYAIDFLKEWVIYINNVAKGLNREKRNISSRINSLKNDNKKYNEQIKLLKDTRNYIIQSLNTIDDDTKGK